jgi:hypothetical protein
VERGAAVPVERNAAAPAAAARRASGDSADAGRRLPYGPLVALLVGGGILLLVERERRRRRGRSPLY